MKRIIAILALMMIGITANALDWNTCLKYVTQADPSADWVLKTDNGEDGIHISVWKSTLPKPTKAELVAIEAEAVAWKKAIDDDKRSDIDEISPEVMKAMLRAIVKVVNVRLPADKKITADEMKQAIKQELQ